MAIIDASVYVASINQQEEFHERSITWLRGAIAAKTPLVAPAIFLAEVAAAIGRGQDDVALARRAVALLRSSRLIHLHPVSIALAESAGRIAAERQVRGCDAVYIALAQQLNQPLVTLDRQQARRSSSMIQVIEP
jgi:predicted nucleic acid-binding protein